MYWKKWFLISILLFKSTCNKIHSKTKLFTSLKHKLSQLFNHKFTNFPTKFTRNKSLLQQTIKLKQQWFLSNKILQITKKIINRLATSFINKIVILLKPTSLNIESFYSQYLMLIHEFYFFLYLFLVLCNLITRYVIYYYIFEYLF